MSASESDDEVVLDKEYVGAPPPPGVHVPTASELLSLCDAEVPRSTLTLPSDPPSGVPAIWVKYGYAVYWNEVLAQSMAYHELRRLGSAARAPAVYYAFQLYHTVYLVMEYIPGRTVGEAMEDETTSDEEKEHIKSLVALCLSEMHRIPIAPGTRPTAIDGGKLRYTGLDDSRGPRYYENTDQLEAHMNKEPMVFCQSDWYHGNFMIDDAGRIVAIDFSETSIVPASFARYKLYDHRLAFDLPLEQVYIPMEGGIDNVNAVNSVCGIMAMASYFFARVGKRTPGGTDEEQQRLKETSKSYYPRPDEKLET
ncbi:Protein kinase-like domain protein [Niveomyces insectorum RCEF 264]|uniref:Protein kinase-like domain protein n=1 Tax=Niveomyces insectorum RCEF 264 TaxID=1081102 RepID=A0A167REK0_9HYPO|nr:Protein kinase-like domain protein [Niveomyces insectorum RCEF 264]